MVQSKKSNQNETNLFSFSFFYINKGDITSHWFGHSDLEELYINDFFERKHIIEDMEAELTEAPIKTSNTDN